MGPSVRHPSLLSTVGQQLSILSKSPPWPSFRVEARSARTLNPGSAPSDEAVPLQIAPKTEAIQLVCNTYLIIIMWGRERLRPLIGTWKLLGLLLLFREVPLIELNYVPILELLEYNILEVKIIMVYVLP